MPTDRRDRAGHRPTGEATRRKVSAHLADHGRGIRLARRAARRALRRLADRHRRTARRRPTTMSATCRPACRAAARRTVWTECRAAATAIRCSTSSARASRCCASAARRRTRARSKPRRTQRSVPLKVIDLPHADARDLYGRDLVADPARPVCRLARQRAARRCRPPDRAPDRRSLTARSCCHARRSRQIDFWRSARQSRRQIHRPGAGTREDHASCQNCCP